MKIVLLIILLAASIEDIKEKRIMNLFPFLIILIKVIYLIVVFQKEELIKSGLGMMVAIVTMLICKIVSSEGIGAGDIKLIISIGFFLGIKLFLSVLFIISLISLIYSLLLLATKKASKNTSLPFAPFIFLGTVIATLIEVF